MAPPEAACFRASAAGVCNMCCKSKNKNYFANFTWLNTKRAKSKPAMVTTFTETKWCEKQKLK